ncbi:protein kinase domain-containing protein [Streptomyces niveus]|uniref:protein kinase domain-containing protein n=1 Tax=Streptomyces niveus TaxID=193462 RepID=UPI00341FE587
MGVVYLGRLPRRRLVAVKVVREEITGHSEALARAVRERGPRRQGAGGGAEGLASVHAYGVTHRDLKPQNVLLGSQGPQLIDFGIARGVEQTTLTQDGQAPGFTAPEVLTHNEVDAAAVSYRAVHEEIDTDGSSPVSPR